MRKMKCFLGMLLMAAMVLSVLPVNTIAVENEKACTMTENVESDDAAVNSGTLNISTCGDVLTWTLMPDGTLTIASSGNMRDYYRNTTGYDGYGPPARYDYRENITAVVIGDEVTGIGADGTALSKTVDSPESYIHRMADGGDIYMAIMKFATSAYNYFH